MTTRVKDFTKKKVDHYSFIQEIRNAMLEKSLAKESHLYAIPSRSIPSQLIQHIKFTKA
jgi:hypothetical protein